MQPLAAGLADVCGPQDATVPAIQNVVNAKLKKFFLEVPPFDLAKVLRKLQPHDPAHLHSLHGKRPDE